MLHSKFEKEKPKVIHLMMTQYTSKIELTNMSKYKCSTVQNSSLETEFRNSHGYNMFKDETLYYGPTNLYTARLQLL
jgi:hypothetical protein